jgi:ankyrin repeat protein
MEDEKEGKMEIVKYLIEDYEDVNEKKKNGDNDIKYECENGKNDVEEIIMKYGDELENE